MTDHPIQPSPASMTSSSGPRVIEVPERLPEARYQLDPRAKSLWRVEWLISGTIMTGITAAITFGLRLFLFDYGIMWAVGITGAVLLFSLLNLWLSPNLRYRYWRYEIRADEADLQHGWVTRTRQLIPMSRIQHVDTNRGPLERRFGLASVVLYTASGASLIPALANDVAADVRDRIATLANVHDDL
jgi:membrane protein YdbS with pleckstrin-like domain